MSLILSGTDGLSDVDGSAATPAIRGTDANTGIFFPAADTIAFSEGGAEVMRINSSGNVGIATNSPEQALDVRGRIQVSNGTNGGQLGVDGGGLAISSIGAAPILFSSSTFATERMRIDSSGNLILGATSSSHKLRVVDSVDRTEGTSQFSITGNGYSAYHFMDGTAYYIGQNSNARQVRMYAGSQPTTGVTLGVGATSWSATSDERKKDIIEDIADATQKLSGLRTVIGKYKTDDEEVRRSFLIAQDVQAVFPEAIGEDPDGTLGLRYTDLIPVLVKAIQEQQALITTLTERITALEAKWQAP